VNRVQTWLAAHPKANIALTAAYYFAIIGALLVMYGRGNFETPEFVYQDF